MFAINRRLVVAVIAAVYVAALSLSTVLAQSQRPDDGGFKPVGQLPAAEQFPAAPLVVAAYSVVLVVLFLYVVSVARRLTAVQREVERLESDVKRTGRA